VLDNCEHVIEAAARMAEAVLRAAPHARVVATSREPLRAPGEHVYQVPSLEVPPENMRDREDLLQTAAVSLFVARTRAVAGRFSPNAQSAATMGAVCRRLDGIPLAIELAAARTATLGLDELAARLDDRFRVLTGGHRTALPRQQTLRATLDWSYELLPAIEQTVLRRLAIFAGGFALEAASAVVTADDLDAPEVVDIVTNLAAKSLIVVEIVDADAQYRLLETTRAYALEKLADSGELDQVARRHAQHYQVVFERAEAEWDRPTLEWLAVYGRHMDNVRAALDWAFSPSGDGSIGVALTTSALPLWFHQSLLLECHGRVERALASLAERPGGTGAARCSSRQRSWWRSCTQGERLPTPSRPGPPSLTSPRASPTPSISWRPSGACGCSVSPAARPERLSRWRRDFAAWRPIRSIGSAARG
jgi:predicted ATPase